MLHASSQVPFTSRQNTDQRISSERFFHEHDAQPKQCRLGVLATEQRAEQITKIDGIASKSPPVVSAKMISAKVYSAKTHAAETNKASQ